MSTRKISPDQLGDAINDILTEYAETLVTDTKEAVQAAGKVALETAKAYASQIGHGNYAKSLSLKKTEDSGRAYMGAHVTIYSTQYRIAHLLEHGHAKVTHSGKVLGTTRAFPHFAPAEAVAESALESKIKQAIRGA